MSSSTESPTKIIAVTGATGAQGGGVVNILSETPGWTVRAITRNPSSEAASKLSSLPGVQVVRADFEDESSLRSAFEGASAIFAVTNWWEALFSGAGKTQQECGEIEERHGMNLARAAAATKGLEHYMWSTQPSVGTHHPHVLTQGELQEGVPHMDYKARVDARIKKEFPELAAKTTYLYFGYYPQNMVFFPLMKPFELPGNGQYIQLVATNPSAKILLAGDMSVNPGIWVRQVLKTGAPAFGKYANVALERWSFQEMADKWAEIVTEGKKRCVVVHVSGEAWTQLWGLAGRELSWQFRLGELVDPWDTNGREGEFISAGELGIKEEEVVGFEGAIRGLKGAALF